jgi:uncharacterized protein (DUF2147 family)
MNRLLRSGLIAALVFAFGASAALAQSSEAPSVVGTWRTIDDKTGNPRSIVKIYKENGALHGRVVEILQVGDDAERNSAGKVICTECEGNKKGQPIEGMVILEGLEKNGDEWSGGTILDPSNGKQYKAKMELDGDDRLDVRGYIGVSLFGRTQTWQRVTQRK